ncbi:MAG: type VI secretion system tip protein TssI/VgrG [Polyangiaceae bacterium]
MTDELRIQIESAALHGNYDVRRLRVTEGISRLFDAEVEIVWTGHADIPGGETLIGADVSVHWASDDGAGRTLHGIVIEVEDLHAETQLRAQRLTIAPKAHSLRLVQTQDIFMDESVPSVIRAKLEALGLATNLQSRLLTDYPIREFIVQFQETDHAFVSRLAENLGISYFFESSEVDTHFVLTDHNGGFPRHEPVHFHAGGERRAVFQLRSRHRLIPGFYAIHDYNYRTPQSEIDGSHQLDGGLGGVIEFGAHVKSDEEAAVLARIRAEESQCEQLVFEGKSHIPSFGAGVRVLVDEHPDLGSVELLLVEVIHEAVAVVGNASSAEPTRYENRFRAIPASAPFRPKRVTPRPSIHGLLTGLVDAGGAPPDARYAQIDEHGRYMVRFFFDPTAPGERPPSRPIRMLQNHAGENYGTHFPLKPGTEVAIGFVHGDPDRPVIVGAIPNPIKPSPVTGASPGVHRMRTSTGITVDMVE